MDSASTATEPAAPPPTAGAPPALEATPPAPVADAPAAAAPDAPPAPAADPKPAAAAAPAAAEAAPAAAPADADTTPGVTPASTAGAGEAAADDKEAPLLPGFTEHIDLTTGRPMWYNVTTRQTTWLRPTAGKAPTTRGDWMEMWDPVLLRPYYFHTITRQSQWHMPSTFLEAAGDGSDVAKTAWLELLDEATQRKYYYSSVTGRVQWKRPDTIVLRNAPSFPQPRVPATGGVESTPLVTPSSPPAGAGAGTSSPIPIRSKSIAKPTHVFAGLLWKQGGGSTVLFGKKNWKERYVVIDTGKLAYYKSRASYSLGEAPMKNLFLHLTNYDVDDRPGDPAQFRLVPNVRAKAAYQMDNKTFPPPNRKFEFKVADPSKKEVWIKAIHDAVATSPGSPASSGPP